MSEISPEQIARTQHKDWLRHPTTIQLLRCLESHKQSFIKVLSADSGNLEKPDVLFRLQAYGIRTTDAIITLIINTDKFIENSK